MNGLLDDRMTGLDVAAAVKADKLVESVEDLQVFKMAYDLSLQIHRLSFELPKHEQYELASQIRRASKGICANLTEGFSKQQFSKPEFRRFIGIAIGSVSEVQLWLRYAVDLGYFNAGTLSDLHHQYDIISKMLQKLHANVRS